MANIIIKATRAKSPFSPKTFITSEKFDNTFQKPGVSGPKISPINKEIAINKPKTSVDL